MRRWAAYVCLVAPACSYASPATVNPSMEPIGSGSVRAGVHAREDPTVRGARLVPESLDLSTATVDGSGSSRGIVQGVRFVADGRGRVLTTNERLDDAASSAGVPARLGGGFLFIVGDTIYRADEWLGRLRPIFRSSRGQPAVFAGLDRMYVRSSNGSHVAFDPRSGDVLDLGPWPIDPHVGSYVALDGWRALALTDVRGVLATTDAGRRWTQLDIPILAAQITPVRRDSEHDVWIAVAASDAIEAAVLSDGPLHSSPSRAAAPGAIALGATAPSATPARCFLVSPTLEVSALASCDEVRVDGHGAPDTHPHADMAFLRAAVEDGWPLADGTAIVAGAGKLSRISLADGSVVSVTDRAFDPRLARCHAVPLAHRGVPTGFGFVCGASAGKTLVARYDEDRGAMVPLHEFSTPRVAQTSGSGTWLVHGACGDDSGGEGTRYCVGTPSVDDPSGYVWHERTLEGAASGAVGVLADGRIVRVSLGATLDDASLLISDGVTTVRRPLGFVGVPEATRRFLARGVWLGGLEERRANTLGGWVAAEGTVVGVLVDLDGTVHAGTYIREIGSPFVAGRYGLAWSRAHYGYETTDGGQTWTHISAPTLLTPSSARACGPAGCSADGWLRVGWGDPEAMLPARPSPSPLIRSAASAPFALTCVAADGAVIRSNPADSLSPPMQLIARGVTIASFPQSVVSPTNAQPRADAWFAPPTVTRAETQVHSDVVRMIDAGVPGDVVLARLYAWGPSSDEWTGTGRWVARWRSPFAGLSGVVSTAVTPAPFHDAASASADLGTGRGNSANGSWAVAVAEDGAHALFLQDRRARPPDLTAVDEGGKLWPIVREDGEPWGLIDAAIHVAGDWYIATSPDAHRHTIDVFRADSRGARLLARVPRHLGGAGLGSARLARGIDGNTVGLIVDGEVLADRNVLERWVVPIELESGQVDPPEPLGAADLSDRGAVANCSDSGGAGWVLDTTWPNAIVTVSFGGTSDAAVLRQVYARLRISTDRACIERLTGAASTEALEVAVARGRGLPSERARRALATSGVGFPVVAVTDTPVLLSCTQTEK